MHPACCGFARAHAQTSILGDLFEKDHLLLAPVQFKHAHHTKFLGTVPFSSYRRLPRVGLAQAKTKHKCASPHQGPGPQKTRTRPRPSPPNTNDEDCVYLCSCPRKQKQNKNEHRVHLGPGPQKTRTTPRVVPAEHERRRLLPLMIVPTEAATKQK